jgi:hypothetical protein
MSAVAELPLSQGATEIPDRPLFLMLGVDAEPHLYFANTNAFSYHYDFATEALHVEQSLSEFNAVTYFRDDRSNLAGTVLAHDGFEAGGSGAGDGGRGIYAIEFWPTDPVRARHVAIAFQAITSAMPFVAGKLAYHPAGDTQEANLIAERAEFDHLGIRVVLTAELFGNVSYTPLNLGAGFGTLRLVDPAASAARPATIRDVAIFATLPNDVSHVAGMISETPQTPLSHINLKAKQNATPNAYIRAPPPTR